MFHNKKYPKDKKLYGGTLPINKIWGHFATKRYMGTLYQYKYGDRVPIKNIWGQIANKNTPDPSFKHYYRTVTAEMCVRLQRIHNLMMWAKECIKQLEMF